MIAAEHFNQLSYQNQGGLILLVQKRYPKAALVGLDEPLQESTIFETSGEIGVLFDYNTERVHESVLLKHGTAEEVEKHYDSIKKPKIKDEPRPLVFVKGQFSVIELNKMINISGYVGTWYSTLIDIGRHSDVRPKNRSSISMGLSL